MKELFKIRHKQTLLFSEGGSRASNISWSPTGKVWKGIGPLRNHLRQHKKEQVSDWEVVRFIANEVGEPMPASELYEIGVSFPPLAIAPESNSMYYRGDLDKDLELLRNEPLAQILDTIGNKIGYGRAQQILQIMWAKHLNDNGIPMSGALFR
jgi:hypothetical protein